MFRSSYKFHSNLCRKSFIGKTQCMYQSTQKGHSGSGTKVAISVAGVASVVTGIVGYSYYSPENRKSIESTIPGSGYLLESLLGPLDQPLSTPKPIQPPKKEPSPLTPKAEPNKTSSSALPPLPPPPILEEPKKDGKEQTLKPKPKDIKEQVEIKENEKTPDLSSNLESSQEAITSENDALSKRLTAFTEEIQGLISSATASSEEAIKAVRSHAQKAYEAIDSGEGGENLYAAVAEMAKIKKDVVKNTEEKLMLASEKIHHLESEINAGRKSCMTKENDSLTQAEEMACDFAYTISKIKSTLAEALRDSSVVNEFKDLVEAGRTQFEAEVRSLLPDVKIGEKSDKLTTDELNMLLTHAHRKVVALQKALAKQQTIDKERFKESVLRQREMEAKLVDGKLNAELERQRRDLVLENRHRLQQQREDYEIDLRNQLKRQAAAHSDHLADVLDQQERSLDTKWQCKLQDEVQRESDKYYMSMSKVIGELDGIKTALKSRASADKAAHLSHELWLACESLKMALRFGRADAKSWEERMLPLQPHIDSIKKASGPNDPFVSIVTSALPESALTRGVLTDEALKERFMKVDRVCRRVALVGDDGASLPRYLLSYVQSFFLINAFDRIPDAELRDEQIDPFKLDTHDVLARVRFCLAKDDFTQAVRYLNLLRGEARNVASSWLSEARLSLEVKQAADALMAHAAATGARAL